MNLKREKPEEFIDRLRNEIANSLLEKDGCNVFGEADFYARYRFRKVRSVSLLIVNSFLKGTPRTRWTILKGDFKSRKTSYANAVLKFFEGVNINVNVDKQRLSFYLDQAIGKRFALFDDVKGRSSVGSDLQGGWGFSSIDDLTDHIDGHVEVQLEKKISSRSHKFSPQALLHAIYPIPESVGQRVQGPIKISKSDLWEKHPVQVTMEMFYIGGEIFNLFPAPPALQSKIMIKKIEWWKNHDLTCKCTMDREEKNASERATDNAGEETPAEPKNTGETPSRNTVEPKSAGETDCI
ncbi:Large T antigen [Araneus ventricosus]|uniref:Large T antigen n=1 Tax=Araneus ventricosus TaxID=182803 RepID=A0A4Y2V1S5_ARAVE|nr:Large T antigen [Araneus ventricosus]